MERWARVKARLQPPNVESAIRVNAVSGAERQLPRHQCRHRLANIGRSPPAPDQTDAVVDAAVRMVAKSASSLALVPIEDVLGLTEQPNVPGTIDEHPNWRRRLDAPASTILDMPAAGPRLQALRERGR